MPQTQQSAVIIILKNKKRYTSSCLFTAMNKNKKSNVKFIIALCVIAIVFNPLVQIYLYKKSLALPVCGITIAAFLIYAFKKYKDLK